MFISGGRAPEYIRYDQELLRVTREIAAAGKPIASVCHGVEILTAANIIQGKNVTTVAKCQLDVEQGGGVYVNRDVVIDGQLVSARTWHDNAPLLREFLKLLAPCNPAEPAGKILGRLLSSGVSRLADTLDINMPGGRNGLGHSVSG